MYQLYIERKNGFSAKLIGEYKELEDAQERAEKEKSADESIKYVIQETTGSFDSYGDLLTYVVEEG